MPKNNKEFEIPESFFSSLNEYSHGGFLLFTFDSHGGLVVNSQFDTFQNSAAMQYHLTQWVNALNNLNLLSTTNSIANHNKKKN